ncbi:hypothetical protein F4803DRAFT_554698 [Xylaria telfairii]|nr:hypothetical protein F4803DRAFT_554698 [Xylaria telfairii]
MEDASMPMDPEPIPLPVMGMTAAEYQTAFAYLDHINFAREIEEYNEQRRRGSMATIVECIPFYKRYEFWALILGLVSLLHALSATWLVPLIRKKAVPLAYEEAYEY